MREQDPNEAAKEAIRVAKEQLDKLFIIPSREKSMAHTKLDEAMLWATFIGTGPL